MQLTFTLQENVIIMTHKASSSPQRKHTCPKMDYKWFPLIIIQPLSGCLWIAKVAKGVFESGVLTLGKAGLAEAQQQQAEDAVSSIVIRNAERRHWAQPWKRNQEQMQQPVCTLHLPDALRGWRGPRLKLALPSFR